MKLKLVNNLSKTVYELNNLTGNSNSNLFYKLNVSLPANIEEGEYNYYLYDDNDVELAKGLAQVGDYAPEKKTYTQQNNNGFIQYNG